MANDLIKFGDFLKRDRDAVGDTLLTLSRKIGVVPTALFKYEKGLAYPRDRILKKLCNYFKWRFDPTKLSIENEKKYKFVSAKYPALRHTLMSSYSAELFPADIVILAAQILPHEFAMREGSPIEEKLYEIAICELKTRHHVIIKDIAELAQMDEKSNVPLFKKAIASWGYDPIDKILKVELMTGKKEGRGGLRIAYKMKFSWERVKVE